MLRRRWPVIVFIAWTGYVWITRIVNAWSASDESTGAKVISTIVAAALVAGAVAIAATLVRSRARALTITEIRLFRAMALATAVVWAVRVPQIVLDADRGVAFKVVHVMLAVVSLALAGLTWRSADREATTNRASVPAAPPSVSPAR